MNKLSRFLYLIYYLKEMNWFYLASLVKYANKITRKNKIELLLDSIYSVFKFNVSILEYFQFRFFEKSAQERVLWAGTGFMYEYQLMMNPKHTRKILDDKTLFHKEYCKFMVHKVFNKEEFITNPNLIDQISTEGIEKLVFKKKYGKCGRGIKIELVKNFTNTSLITYMNTNGFDLAEQFIEQHPFLNQLSPSAVNTIRIFTQITQYKTVDILGCRLRISINSNVDNLAAGNIAAPIDVITGIVNGRAVYSDPSKDSIEIHPLTGEKIIGFKVPYWKETLEMVEQAALYHPENRSIGWDIVITPTGPGLIEGNHDWCKLLWQLPVQRGLKPILEKYT